MTDRRGPDPDRKTDIALDTPRLRIELPVLEDAPGLYELVGGDDRLAICQFSSGTAQIQSRTCRRGLSDTTTQSYGEGGFTGSSEIPQATYRARAAVPLDRSAPDLFDPPGGLTLDTGWEVPIGGAA